jgi:hypothetical protein
MQNLYGWECRTYQSEWKSGSTSGGSGAKLQGFFSNKFSNK